MSAARLRRPSTRSEHTSSNPAPGPRVTLSQGQALFARLEQKLIVIAHVLGITPQAVSRIAKGRSRPSLDLAVKIEERLGIPVKAFCTKLPVEQKRLPEVIELAISKKANEPTR